MSREAGQSWVPEGQCSRCESNQSGRTPRCSDIFRSHDLGGGAKALWVIFVIILPFLGIFVYLIARGGKMHERAAKQGAQQQEAFDAYVKETAGAGDSSPEQLAKLADLKQQGVITDAEFESQKAKILAA
jgi:hypothetical protein